MAKTRLEVTYTYLFNGYSDGNQLFSLAPMMFKLAPMMFKLAQMMFKLAQMMTIITVQVIHIMYMCTPAQYNWNLIYTQLYKLTYTQGFLMPQISSKCC